MIAESTFLAGKLLKRSLPIIEGPVDSQVPNLKRLLLPQGELAQFHDADQGMRYIAFIELVAGGTRGHHYHKLKEEWVYLIDGEALLLVEDLEGQSGQSLRLLAGDLVVIQPLVAHALQTVRPGRAIEFSPTRFSAADIYQHFVKT